MIGRWRFFGLYLVTLFCTTFSTLDAFDRIENWGFDQGGGYRMGSFVGDDINLVVTGMELSPDNKTVAVGGALHNKWAVRVYSMGANGPEIVGSWNGLEQNRFLFSTITSIAWMEDGIIKCGIEHLVGDQMRSGILSLDLDNQQNEEFLELKGWNSLTEIKVDPSGSGELFILGTKKRQTFCRSINALNITQQEFRIPNIAKPRAMAIQENRIWISGDNSGQNSFVEVFEEEKTKRVFPLGPGVFVSAMETAGENVYLTGRKKNSDKPNEMEDFFLHCLVLDETKGVDLKWESNFESFPGKLDREVGVDLVALEDGGVVVIGNFRRYWKLGSTVGGELALLPPDSSDGVNFETFLSRFSSEGELLWAQTSATLGDDFGVALASDGEGGAILLGNRNIGGSFGPYLSRVRLGGSESKDVVFVQRDVNKVQVVTWDPPKTIRLGEPMDGSYLSARSSGGGTFEYKLQDGNVNFGIMPFFEPGELSFSAMIDGEVKATRSIKGLKGRPYLMLDYEQNGSVVLFVSQLSGLHPNHSSDSEKNKQLHEHINFEFLVGEVGSILEGGKLNLESDFNGLFEVVASFPGDEHYESATRSIFLQARNGKVFKPGEEVSGSVRLQVKDLDGWQKERIVTLGEETFVAATQGFGRKRKFKSWMEFSDERKVLTTARVESPFSLRTALIAGEDMILFAHYNFTFVGAAVNGYLGGSTVFLDFNLNGELDFGEPSGLSTSNGGFEIEVSEEEIQAQDQNSNGVLDPSEAMLVVVGGVDHSSRIPLAISYRSPPSYSVITAVSTLTAKFTEQGFDLSEAEEIVRQYLSLPEGIEFSTFEPLREMRNDGDVAKEFILKSTKLANILNQGSRFIKSISGNRISRIKGAELVVAAIKNKVLEADTSGRRSSDDGSFDFNDPEFLIDVLNSAESLSETEIDESDLEIELSVDDSVRGELSESQPDIAETGNEQMLNELVEQIASANVSLDDLSDSPDVSPEEFKVLASASQSILDDLGELTTNTLFEEEVDQLLELSGAEAQEAQVIINSSVEIDNLPDEIGIPTGENSSAASFSADALDDLSSNEDINVFAPVLTNPEISAPNEFNDNLIIGTLLATDPEGGEVTYSIVGDNPDFDLDGASMLSIHPDSGEISIMDFDDLRLMSEDVVSPILRVSDPKGLYTDEAVSIDLSDWTYLAGRLEIPDLALTIPENLPVGTLVHNFDAVDVYGGSITYSFVSGEGSTDNALFTLEENGTLKTNIVFDYESDDDIAEIRIQAIDSRFSLVEDFLQIQITDVFVPSVQTGSAKIIDGQLTLDATLNRFGDNGNALKLGFLVARSPIEDLQASGLNNVYSNTESETSYSAVTDLDSLGGIYYFIAFAENDEGTNYGLQQSFLVPKITAGSEWNDGEQVDNYSGWWNSPWMGLYHAQSYPWIYHQNLGWVFVHLESSVGSWLYHQRLGWMWTMPDVFPHLFLSKRNHWVHVNQSTAKTTIYDYQEEEWFEPDTPITISAKEESHIGGEVTGYGNYYRWDPVILEAQTNTNYNFAGWSGGMNSMEQMIEFEALRNLEVDASFLAIPSLNSSAQETLKNITTVLEKMDHLSEAEKEKSIAELFIFGTSPTSGLSIIKKP